MESENLEKLKSNILSWYPIKEKAKVLILGEEKENVKRLLTKNKCKIYVDFEENTKYDYIVVLNKNIEINKLEKFLEVKGKLLIILDNKFGISNFLRYSYERRAQGIALEKEYINKDKVYKDLKKNGFKSINTYMIYPNYKQVDLVILDREKITSDKLEKYFKRYNSDDIILADEIVTLKEMIKTDKELFKRVANSYIIEASKEELDTNIRYVFFNNYRKDKYELVTIIKDNRVEKKGVTESSKKYLNEVKTNLKELEKFNVEVLDRAENGIIYSEFVKGETLDIQLAVNMEKNKYVENILKKLKNRLLQNSKKNIKISDLLAGEDEALLEELNYLEYCFYDMVPKNCFYKDNEFYFFDQEFMEKGLPIEFVIYRSIINSYDLVRKINVDDLMDKLGILKYKEIFERLNENLRNKIVDSKKYNYLESENKNMYELVYEDSVLRNEIKNYKINDENQSNYIFELEENNKKQYKYIKELEENNKKQDEYIKMLEQNKKIKKR